VSPLSVTALLAGFGGYTTHVVVDADVVVPLPVGVSAITAVTALESYGTAEFAVTERVTISPSEWVVVFGAGGGLGLAAVDVARGLGARVIGVASSEEKRSAARAAGAEIVLDYPDVKERIRAATQGGADVVIDPVGGAAAEAGLRGLRPGGRFCVLGFASGEIPRLAANLVLLGNRSVIGVDWGDRARTAPAATAGRLLNLDQIGAEFVKVGRGQRRCGKRGEIEHPHPGEHGRIPFPVNHFGAPSAT
jgi:NADPH2:quinone reductase